MILRGLPRAHPTFSISPCGSVAEDHVPLAEHYASLAEHDAFVAEHHFSMAQHDALFARHHVSAAQHHVSVIKHHALIAQYHAQLLEHHVPDIAVGVITRRGWVFSAIREVRRSRNCWRDASSRVIGPRKESPDYSDCAD